MKQITVSGSQANKTILELQEENQNIRNSLLQMKKTSKTEKLAVRLTLQYRTNEMLIKWKEASMLTNAIAKQTLKGGI